MSLETLSPASIPLVVKLAYTAFMAVLVPVYLRKYGPRNFLYICDAALLLTLLGIWLESPLLISVAAVGILLPQLFWVVDFLANCVSLPTTGMTDYMFESQRPLLLRGLSLFHGWLPILLLYLLSLTGYDARALPIWTGLATALLLVCYFIMPGPTPKPGLSPVNINYVHGFSDHQAQNWMPPLAWLGLALIGSPIIFYLPAHLLLTHYFGGG